MRVLLPRTLVCIVPLAVALLAPRADAQLGALRRAAERRVEQKAEDRVAAANLIEPTFDATTIEITSERLDRYTAAMLRLKGQRAANRQKYEELRQRADAVRDSARALENRREADQYERTRSQYGECRDQVRAANEAEQERRMQELTTRMQRDPVGAQNDPKVKQIVAAMQEMAAAQGSGDQARIDRATQRIASVMGAGAADSASLDRASVPKCGARPTMPASMRAQAAMTARADALQAQAQALNSTSGGVSAEDAGMTLAQARMFWERIMSWLNGMNPNAPITRTFTKAEYDLLVARRGDLRKAFSGGE